MRVDSTGSELTSIISLKSPHDVQEQQEKLQQLQREEDVRRQEEQVCRNSRAFDFAGSL